MKLIKKIFIELTTCPDNKTISTAKVAFWLVLLAALGYAGWMVVSDKTLSLSEFASSMATLFGIGSAPVIAEEMSDRKGGMANGAPIGSEEDLG
jgi:hypothetical protein